jgi:hypothetical protein
MVVERGQKCLEKREELKGFEGVGFERRANRGRE